MKTKTKEEIIELAKIDASRNYNPLFNYYLIGEDLKLYIEEREKAEIIKAYEAGKRHACYGWAKSYYASPARQEAYNRGYREQKNNA